MNKTAKHLASFGRHGDDMVMHVSRDEVRGLQALAKANGTSLTTNPHTGMPEAFNFGRFAKGMLPAAAGLGLTALSGGALSPLMAAGLVGGGTGLATGSLEKGMIAGLGAWGGAGLGSSLGALGAEAGAQALGDQAAQIASNTLDPGLSSVTGGQTLMPQEISRQVASGQMPIEMANQYGQAYSNAFPQQIEPSISKGFDQATSSLSNAGNFAANNYGKLGAAFGPGLIEGMTPEGKGFSPMGETPSNYDKNSFYYNDPNRPNPYYQPTGLGYGARGGLTVDLLARGGRPNRSRYDYEELPPYEAAYKQVRLAAQRAQMPEGYPLLTEPKGIRRLGDLPGRMSRTDSTRMAGGGRLLRGLGDGVSDSIPAQVGNQPVQLADGEFIVPARTVSELGNGSTDAGSKRLLEMIERVEKHRRRSMKDYAKDTKAYKGLPA